MPGGGHGLMTPTLRVPVGQWSSLTDVHSLGRRFGEYHDTPPFDVSDLMADKPRPLSEFRQSTSLELSTLLQPRRNKKDNTTVNSYQYQGGVSGRPGAWSKEEKSGEHKTDAESPPPIRDSDVFSCRKHRRVGEWYMSPHAHGGAAHRDNGIHDSLIQDRFQFIA